MVRGATNQPVVITPFVGADRLGPGFKVWVEKLSGVAAVPHVLTKVPIIYDPLGNGRSSTTIDLGDGRYEVLLDTPVAETVTLRIIVDGVVLSTASYNVP